MAIKKKFIIRDLEFVGTWEQYGSFVDFIERIDPKAKMNKNPDIVNIKARNSTTANRKSGETQITLLEKFLSNRKSKQATREEINDMWVKAGYKETGTVAAIANFIKEKFGTKLPDGSIKLKTTE